MKTSELLRKAADEIRRRGWFQGAYGDVDPDGETPLDEQMKTCRVCAWGAVRSAANGSPYGWEHDTATPVDRSILALTGVIPIPSVPDWNDAPGRTVEEVLDAFERAAQAAETAGD